MRFHSVFLTPHPKYLFTMYTVIFKNTAHMWIFGCFVRFTGQKYEKIDEPHATEQEWSIAKHVFRAIYPDAEVFWRVWESITARGFCVSSTARQTGCCSAIIKDKDKQWHERLPLCPPARLHTNSAQAFTKCVNFNNWSRQLFACAESDNESALQDIAEVFAW